MRADIRAWTCEVRPHVLIKGCTVIGTFTSILFAFFSVLLVDFADHNFVFVSRSSRSTVAFSASFILNTTPVTVTIVASGSRVCWLLSTMVFKDKLILHRRLQSIIFNGLVSKFTKLLYTRVLSTWRATLRCCSHCRGFWWLGAILTVWVLGGSLMTAALLGLIVRIATVHSGGNRRVSGSLRWLIAGLCILFEKQVISRGQVIMLIVLHCTLNWLIAEAEGGLHFEQKFLVHCSWGCVLVIILVLWLVKFVPRVLLETLNIDALCGVGNEYLR